MKKFLSALSFLLSILLLMLTAACEKSVDSKPENTVLQTEYESTVSQAEMQMEKEKENNLDRQYNTYINDTKLSNFELSLKIDKLADGWHKVYLEYYDLTVSMLSGDDLLSYKAYLESLAAAEAKQAELFEKLVFLKYESGSIGSIELAKNSYQQSKQKAENLIAIYNYLQD